MSATHFNSITLVGRVAALPEPSHVSHGEAIFRLMLAVERLSGRADVIPVHVRKSLLGDLALREDENIAVEGEIRSFNNKSGVGARLILSVFAHDIYPTDRAPFNAVMLSGAICRLPIYRHTPLGREICDVMLAVNRRYMKSDYIPCIAWGINARVCADKAVGSLLAFEGRMQSREYIKSTEEGQTVRTAFEVSVVTLLDEITE